MSAPAPADPMATDRVQPALSEWTPVQLGVLLVCAFQLLWALAGFIAEPTFAVGDDAPTERVLGVDFNGWHALSGLLLFGPGLIAALRAEWALIYSWAAAAALVATGLWALAETQVAYVFTFPNNEADAVLHLATGAVFAALAIYGTTRRSRLGPPA